MPEPQGEVISPGEIPGTMEGPEGIVAGQAPAGYRYVVKQGNRTRWVWWVIDPSDPKSDSKWIQVTDIVQYWGLESIDPQEVLNAEQQEWLQDFNEREFAYRKDQDWEKRQEGISQWAKDYLLRLKQFELSETDAARRFELDSAAQKALELFRQTEFDWRVATAAKELELELRNQGFVEQAEAFRQEIDRERFEWEKQQSAERLAFDREQLAQQQKQWEDQYALELERLGLDKEAAEFRRIMEEKRLGLDTTIAEQNFRLALERLGLDTQAQEFDQKFAKERFGFEKEQTYWERGFAEKQFAYQLTKDQQDRLAAMIPQMATMSAAGVAAFKDILKGMGIDLDAMLRGMVRAQTPWMKGAPQWVPWGEALYGGGRGLKPTGEPYTDEEIAALNAAVLGQGAPPGAPLPPGLEWYQDPATGQWTVVGKGAQLPPSAQPPPAQPAYPGLPEGVPPPPPEATGGWWYDFETGQWKPPKGVQTPWGEMPPGVPAPPPEAGAGWWYDFETGQWKPPVPPGEIGGHLPPELQPPPVLSGAQPQGIPQPPPPRVGPIPPARGPAPAQGIPSPPPQWEYPQVAGAIPSPSAFPGPWIKPIPSPSAFPGPWIKPIPPPPPPKRIWNPVRPIGR